MTRRESDASPRPQMAASVPGAAIDMRRLRLRSTIAGVQRPYVLMVLWGLAAGLLAALALHAVAPHEWPLMRSRVVGMRASLAVLSEGGPLLAGRHGVKGPYYAVALNDDPGVFLYFPLLGHLLGGVDPVVMLSYFYVVVVAALAAVYPLILYRLTGSLLAGLVAPLMLVVCVLSMGFIDIYWIPAWGMLALLPLLYLIARDRPRFAFVALVAIVLAAGWLSSIRSNSGLGILLIAALVLVLRRRGWWRLLPALALLVLAYLATSTLMFTAIREARDHQLGVKSMPDDRMTAHPLWSTAYIGLGYLRNGYGIHYKDESAVSRVEREAPGTPLASPRFETVMRSAYLDFVKAHPAEALRQYAAKILVSVANMGPYLLLVLLTMPAMLLLGPERATRRLWTLLTLPAMLIALIPPLLAIPGEEYGAQSFGVLGVLGILGICWVIASLESLARRQDRLTFSLFKLPAAGATVVGGPDLLRRSIRISAVAVAVLTLICISGYYVRESAFRWSGSYPDTLIQYLG